MGAFRYIVRLRAGSRLTLPRRASIIRQPVAETRDLPYRHLSRRPDRQLQHLAQCAQVRIPWPNTIRLPEIDARRADTDLFSDFGNRQTTLDPSVAQVAAQTWFARQ